VQDLHTIGESSKVVEFARRRAELRSQVHSGNSATVFRSDPAGRPADTAADVEQIIARLWLEPSDQLLGRDHTPPMEMVNWREGLRRDRHVRAIHVSKRSQHALGDALTRVVLPDRTPVSQLSLRPQLNIRSTINGTNQPPSSEIAGGAGRRNVDFGLAPLM